MGGREKGLKWTNGNVLKFAHPEPRPSPLPTNVSEVTAGPKLAAGGEEELAEGVLVRSTAPRPLGHSYRASGGSYGLVRGMPEFTFLPLAPASQKELTHPLSCHLMWSSSIQSCFLLPFLLRGLLRDASPSYERCQASKSCDWPRGIKGNMIPGQSHHGK